MSNLGLTYQTAGKLDQAIAMLLKKRRTDADKARRRPSSDTHFAEQFGDGLSGGGTVRRGNELLEKTLEQMSKNSAIAIQVRSRRCTIWARTRIRVSYKRRCRFSRRRARHGRRSTWLRAPPHAGLHATSGQRLCCRWPSRKGAALYEKAGMEKEATERRKKTAGDDLEAEPGTASP